MPDFDVMHRGMLNTLKSMQKIEAEKGKIMMGMLEADVKQGGNMMTQMLKNKLDPSKMRKQELWRGMQGGQPGPGGQPQGRPQAPPGYGINPNFRATGAGEPYVRKVGVSATQRRTESLRKNEALEVLKRGWGSEKVGKEVKDFEFQDRQEAQDYIMQEYDVDINDPDVQNALAQYKEREEEIAPASSGFLGIGARKYPTKSKYGFEYEQHPDGKWYKVKK